MSSEVVPVFVPKALLHELRLAEAAVNEQRAIEAPMRAKDKSWGGSAELAKRIARLAEARKQMTAALARQPRFFEAA